MDPHVFAWGLQMYQPKWFGNQAELTRIADTATTTIKVTWEGETTSCAVTRAGGGYAAFETVRTEVIGFLCTRPRAEP